MPGWSTRKYEFCMPPEEKVWGLVYSLDFIYPGWVPRCRLKYFCWALQLPIIFIVVFIKNRWKLEALWMFWLLLQLIVIHMKDCRVCVGPCAGKHSTAGPGWGMGSPVIWAIWPCRLHGVRGVSGGERCWMDFVASPSGRITHNSGPWELGARPCYLQ